MYEKIEFFERKEEEEGELIIIETGLYILSSLYCSLLLCMYENFHEKYKK